MDREQLLKKFQQSSSRLENARQIPLTVCGIFAGTGLIPAIIVGGREVLVNVFGFDRSLTESGTTMLDALVGMSAGAALGNVLDRQDVRRERQILESLNEQILNT